MKLIMDGMAKYGIEETAAKMEPLIDFIRELIERRRAAPAEDIMTGLIHASEDGDSLSDDEVVAMVFLLVVAGYETTYNLITNAIATLLTHREQLGLLRAHPDLITSAVEEILRYTGTIGGTKPNYAAEDVELHGVTIPRGSDRSSRCWPRPTATPLCSTDPTSSTSPAAPITTSHSAKARISASVPTSHAWRPASRSPTSSPDSPTCAWRSTPPSSRSRPSRSGDGSLSYQLHSGDSDGTG